MKSMALGLMIMGAVLIAAGALLWLAARWNLPLGRLPGDLRWQGKGWSISFPIVTCLILSILLTILLNLILRK